MVRHMSEGQVARHKERAVADMRMNKRTHIRYLCRTCKLGSLIDPDSTDLESHLLRHGFMPGYDFEGDEDVNNGGPEDEGVHDDHHEGDGSGGHDDDHHEGDGSGRHDDDHHEGDVAGADGGGEDAASTDTQTRLTSALQDPHVQELLLKEMSNAKAAAKEKAKLATDGPIQKKHHRKRNKKDKLSVSQQPSGPKRPRVQDDPMSQPTKGTLQGIIHKARKPIMTDEQVTNASGAMVNLMHGILFLEEGLLKETNPSYPVFTVKVLADMGFVDDHPVIRLKHIYNF
jgi:hypothetical protein